MNSRLVSVVFLSFILLSSASAQAPKGPVTVISNFAAGGLNDLTARILAEKSKAKFPAGIAVVNRPGAGGTIGVTEVVQAKPDGTTIAVVNAASIVDQPQMNNLPYKTPDDYTTIINTVTYYQMLAVRADAPWKTIQELMDAIRASPGKIRVGSSGIGTAAHLNLEQLISSAKINILHAPFAGWGEGSVALLGGHVDALTINPGEGRQLVNAGRIRVLAAFGPQRSKFYPDAPAFKELGHDIGVQLSFVVIAPKDLPAETRQYFHDVFKAVLEGEDFRKFVSAREIEANYLNSEDTKKMIWNEYRTHTDLLRTLGLQAK